MTNSLFQISYIICDVILKVFTFVSWHGMNNSKRQSQTRINLNYTLLSRLSMDLKVMPRSFKDQKYILCIIDEVTNYLITVSCMSG